MNILDIKIEDILQFPFKKDNWLNTFGIYVLITFLTSISAAIPIIFFIFAGIVLLEIGAVMSITSLIIFFIFALPFILAFTLVQFYLQGYVLEIMDNVKNEKMEEIPKHGEIGKKVRLGFTQFVLLLGPMSITFVFLLLSIAMLVAGAITLESNLISAVLLIILGTLAVTITSFALIGVTTLVFPAMLYIYLEKRSIANAYCFKNIKLVLKNSWKEFLLLYAISMIGFLGISIIGQIPLLGSLAFIIAMPYITFVIAFVTGTVFRKIDKLKLFK